MSPLLPKSSPAATPGAARRLVKLVGALGLVACGGDKPASSSDSTSPVTTPVVAAKDSVAAPVADLWGVADGSAIYLPAEGGSAQVILPPVHDDSVPRPSAVTLPVSVAPASIDLFSPTGTVGTVAVGEYSAGAQPEVADACDAWPVVPLRDVPTGARSWRIALLSGRAVGVQMDSIGGLPPKDSATLVVEINKAAALLPLDSAGMLRRVPFGVTRAYRTRLDGGTELVVAVVERQLNMEASPKTERTVLLLEKASGARAYSAVWRDSHFDIEDELIATELLAVVTFTRESRSTVFLGLDFGDGSRVQMLQRSAGGIWSLRWSSAYTGC